MANYTSDERAMLERIRAKYSKPLTKADEEEVVAKFRADLGGLGIAELIKALR